MYLENYIFVRSPATAHCQRKAMGGDSTLIDQLLAAHGAADAARLEGVVEELSEIAAESFGADAENLASLVRASGGIAVLVGAIDTGCGLALRQSALSLIGNLLTNVFDPEAHQSLQLFAQARHLQQAAFECE